MVSTQEFDAKIDNLLAINTKLLEEVERLQGIMLSTNDEDGEDGEDVNGLETIAMSIAVMEKMVNMSTKLTTSISTILFKSKEMEYKEEIDFHHPKIQKSFLFLLQAVYDSLGEEGYGQDDSSSIMTRLSTKLVGFEEKLNRVFKSVSMSMVDSTVNPFVKNALSHKQE